jgi:hypothetical protein
MQPNWSLLFFTEKDYTAPKNGKKFTGPRFCSEIMDIIEERDWLKKLSWQMLK